jgi:cyclohexanecarboxyl-CoA dehydrogenase
MVLSGDQKSLQKTARHIVRERLRPKHQNREKLGDLERGLIAEMWPTRPVGRGQRGVLVRLA